MYLAGAALMAHVVATVSKRQILALSLFVALALNPVAFSYFQALTLRDGLYFGLAFLTLSAVAWLFAVHRPHRHSRVTAVGSATVIGAVVGLYWLTREEATWLLPSLIAASALPWAVRYASGRGVVNPLVDSDADSVLAAHGVSTAERGTPMLHQFIRYAGVALGALLVLGAVASVNFVSYGVLLNNDFRDGTFPAAYDAFTRVQTGEVVRYEVAPADVRAAVYDVSPAAAELEPWLEKPGNGFVAAGCKARQYSADPTLLPPSCTDYYAGWFAWALRDAIQRAGHWNSAPQAQAFMAQVAGEVDAACRDGRVACRPRSESLSPSLRPQDTEDVARLLPLALVRLANSGEFESRSSYGDTLYLLQVSMMSRTSIMAPVNRPPRVVLEGWVATQADVPAIDVRGGDTETAASTLELKPGRDIESYFASLADPDWHARRFSIETTCLTDGCAVVVSAPLIVVPAIGIPELISGSQRSFNTGMPEAPNEDGARIHFERVEYSAGDIPSVLAGFIQSPNGRVLALLSVLQWSYASIMLPALGFALFGVIASALHPRMRGKYAPLLAIAAACGGAVAVRLTLITTLEVTSWPSALRNHYIDVASPFLVAFVMIGAYLGGVCMVHVVDRSRRSIPVSED